MKTIREVLVGGIKDAADIETLVSELRSCVELVEKWYEIELASIANIVSIVTNSIRIDEITHELLHAGFFSPVRADVETTNVIGNAIRAKETFLKQWRHTERLSELLRKLKGVLREKRSSEFLEPYSEVLNGTIMTLWRLESALLHKSGECLDLTRHFVCNVAGISTHSVFNRDVHRISSAAGRE